MHPQKNRIAVSSFLGLLLMFGATMLSPRVQAQPPTNDVPPSWLQDAELTDVFFLNSDLGWAVGEHGTVLKTADGGANWRNTANLQRVTDRDLQLNKEMKLVLNTLQDNLGQGAAPASRLVPTGINFRFESIHFTDSRHGVVVGGYDVPYMDRSRAVVMRTTDGGESWKMVRGLVIPKLTKVHMHNESAVWAVGDSSNLNRAGIFTSSDGGQAWSNKSGQLRGAFRDAVQTSDSMVAVSAEGKLVVIRGQELEHAVILGSEEPMPINQVEMIDGINGWAVGYSGQILNTRDGGASWRVISRHQRSRINYQAMTLAHGKLWCAGNPGTYLMSVDLEKGTITKHRTPIKTAINSISFPSPERGYAVGDGGNILATLDGGKTWQVQRSAYQRVALMGVSFDLENTPLASLSQYAGENNLATASIHVALDQDQIPLDSVGRIQQATSRLGCNICRVHYTQKEDRARDALRQLTLAIRTLQPNVIVCESTAIRRPDGLIDPQTLLVQAIEAAADRHQFSGQLVELGLPTWQCDRLAVLDPTGRGELKITTDRFLPSAGRTIEDYCAISTALLGLPMQLSQEKTLGVKQFGLVRNFRGSDVFADLKQLSRQVPSRNDGTTRRGNLQMMQQNVRRISDLKTLAQWRDLTPKSLLVWRQKLNSIIVGQDDDLAGVWLARLAKSYMNDGQWQMAAITLNQLAARLEDHPLTPAALLWLAQYHASDEMLVERIRSTQVEDIPLSIEDELKTFNVEASSYQSQAQMIQQDGMTHMVWIPDEVKREVDQERNAQGQVEPKVDLATESYRQANSIVATIRARDPDLAKDRQLRYLEAKLTNRVQGNMSAENLFSQLVRNSTVGDPIFIAGGREIKLAKTDQPPMESLICAPLTERPKLDGDLSDPCWNSMMTDGNASFLKMTPPGEQVPAKTDVVIMAYDDDFLYIAVRCNKLSDYPYQSTDVPRERDADLWNRDRIEFAFDTDRDYHTFLQFSVDHRGWCSDGANGSTGWDPEWFIANSEDEKSWSVELAIPIAQLTSGTPEFGTVWATSAARKMGRYPVNLWPTRSWDFQNQEMGLHRVSELQSKGFELLQFYGTINN